MSIFEQVEQHKLRLWASYSSIFVSFTLVLLKLYAYIETASLSLMSSLIDSSVDLLTSICIFIGVQKAIKPPDTSHRYGHAKAESLVALAQGAFIIGSCVILIYETIDHFIHPVQVENTHIGILIMCVAIFMTILLLLWQNFVIQRTKSIAISADQLHFKGDFFMNIAVLGLFIASGYIQVSFLDPLIAFVVCVFLIYGTRAIIADALSVLMDEELPAEERESIIAFVLNKNALFSREVKGMHDLRTRYDGHRKFIEFHLELEKTLSLDQAHEITDQVEVGLKGLFQNAEVIIHQEPAGIIDERLDHIISQSKSKIVKQQKKRQIKK